MKLGNDVLGKAVAEEDKLLRKAFLEVDEYRDLSSAERPTRFIVVGRRGTGKSALYLNLCDHWNSERRVIVVRIEPDDSTFAAIRDACGNLAADYKQLRRVARLVWHRSILAEICLALKTDYRFTKHADPRVLDEAKTWEGYGGRSLLDRVPPLLEAYSEKAGKDPKTAFIELQRDLNPSELALAVQSSLEKTGLRAVLIADRLDEGWEVTSPCIAFLAGFLAALSSLMEKTPSVCAIAFLRDNIFRALRQQDEDGERLLECSHLRLHWDEEKLFGMLCRRLRVIYGAGADEKSDHEVWNLFADRGIENKAGFKRCLGYTLYRPRDVLELLNRAARKADYAKRTKIIDADVEAAAAEISEHRKSSLLHEYAEIFPAIEILINAFRKRPGVMLRDEFWATLNSLDVNGAGPAELQDLALLPTLPSKLNALYRVGFIGIRCPAHDDFVFCHDGSFSDCETEDPKTQFMVHPCYWASVGCTEVDGMEWANAVQLIHDEYEFKQPLQPMYRQEEIGKLLQEIQQISEGREDAQRFSQWCIRALSILTAGRLRNFEDKQTAAVLRRDIVATIVADEGFWRRVRDDYDVRDIVFEVKNYQELGPDDWAQLNQYLKNMYGRLGFFVTRSKAEDPSKNDIRHLKELWDGEKKIAVIIGETTLLRLLRKARSPDKFTYTEDQLDTILRKYRCNFLAH